MNVVFLGNVRLWLLSVVVFIWGVVEFCILLLNRLVVVE